MFIGFFFFFCLARARSELLYPVCTKRDEAGRKRKEMRNMGKAGSADRKTRGEGGGNEDRQIEGLLGQKKKSS